MSVRGVLRVLRVLLLVLMASFSLVMAPILIPRRGGYRLYSCDEED